MQSTIERSEEIWNTIAVSSHNDIICVKEYTDGFYFSV